VKLSEEKPVVVAKRIPTPTVNAPLTSGQAAARMLKRIKCVNGKLVKKMTGSTCFLRRAD
jgi:hypothetical protein